MSVVLTSYPFDDPDAKELWEKLADVYYDKQPIIAFMKAAQLKPANVNLEDATSIWHQALDQAAKSGKLGLLLDEVVADSESLSLRPPIDRLIKKIQVSARDPEATTFDVFELTMLSPTRSFIGRPDLRRNLKEFGKAHGARVLVVRETRQPGHVGRTHSWYLINEIGQRLRIYDSYRFDLTDWSGPAQGPVDVMAEICGQLGWEAPSTDPIAQPDTVVRLLVAHFKRLGRTLTRRTCLVFDAYTAATADDGARALVVNIAAAANAGEAGNVCVALLEVDASLPPELARDAMPEDLRSACLKDLENFFAASAAAEGLDVSSQDMPLLLEKVLGAPPHPEELVLPTVGPRAAEVAASIFGGGR